MDRVLTTEERIRRAEEIYNNKRNQENLKTATVNISSRNSNSVLKKMIIQIIICILIYIIFYLIQNTKYIFSDAVINKTKDILNYDVNITKIYHEIKNYILKPEEIHNDNEKEENKNNIESKNIVENALGGAIENTSEIYELENDIQLTQMEIDANEIKQKCSIIKPLEGEITSRYGPRQSENAIVSKYHTGIDIAANSGTVIASAIQGTVILVSDQGDFGNHIKISNGDIQTLYAHCKTIYVKQGDIVAQGQGIAEVGSTGNSTGPHLHFEVKIQDRLVDPDYLLEF